MPQKSRSGKPRLKLASLFGIALLATLVAGIAWVAFGGISGCGAGCNPVSTFGLPFGR
jgi:hypothetical protein